MQYTAPQLKERLLEGIDNDNNVVDMPRVLEVVHILEKYPITKDILEETRIGKLVNDVRRKTTNKALAKRAKELVKSWQKLLSGGSEGTPVVNGGTQVVNGDGLRQTSGLGRQGLNTPQSPAFSLSSRSPSTASIKGYASPNNSVDSSLSRVRIPSKPNTPSLPNVNNNKSSSHQPTKRSNTSPLFSGVIASKRQCISPSVNSQPGTPDSVCSQNSSVNNDRPRKGRPPLSRGSSFTSASVTEPRDLQRTRSELILAKEPHGPDLRPTQSTSNLASKGKSGQNGMVVSNAHFNGGEISTPTHSIETKGLKTTIRFNKTSPPVPSLPVNGIVETPKKRGRGRPPKYKPVDQQIPHSASISSVKSFAEKRKAKLDVRIDLESPSYVSLTPKVKSTAELIQELQAKNSLSVSKDTARKIQKNLISKEVDEDLHVQSNVPEGAKPRHHKKRFAPPSTPLSLQQTKNEMVEKFLESSVTPSAGEDLSPLKYEPPRSESPGNASTSFEDRESVDSTQNHCDESTVKINGSDSKTVISNSNKTAIGSENKQNGESSSHDKQLSLDEIYSKYPPIDLENFEYFDDTYELPETHEVTENDVNRLHREHWEGVNGCYNSWGEWRDWSQTVSKPSYNSDMLNILPYVVTDD
ncbi:MED26-like protein [Mya arenaria]|uniref:Mediator of RNA polymerase II transcription subunit 26 n=1 Tax=Mya arenaria TaxID=6604 RepID=A0ABY7FMU8_MYAAR|nr:mediator of RNA polymerase II transcription subunit 26-like [Mya arenaria]WAR23538.1 MED26-like protein [Mya arenaria]